MYCTYSRSSDYPNTYNVVKIWNINDCKCLHNFEVKYDVSDIEWNPAGDKIIISSHDSLFEDWSIYISIFDLETGELIIHTAKHRYICWLNNTQVVAVNDLCITITDVFLKKVFNKLNRGYHYAGYYPSPSGKWIISVKYVSLIDAENYDKYDIFSGYDWSYIAWHPDEHFFMVDARNKIIIYGEDFLN